LKHAIQKAGQKVSKTQEMHQKRKEQGILTLFRYHLTDLRPFANPA
jgi:hypothetical protein